MILPGERVAARPAFGRLRQQIVLTVLSLRAEAYVGSPDLARIGLIVVACALSTIVLMSPGHFRPATNAFFAVVVAFGTLASLAACFAATLRLPHLPAIRARQALATTALVGLLVLSIMGLGQTVSVVGAMVMSSPYSNDGAVMDNYAAMRLRHGHNPYVRTNIVTALAAIDAPSTTTTPLMQGQFRGARAYPSEAAVQQAFMNVLRYQPRSIPPEFESKYNYPAGSFLMILPFVMMGIHDMRFLYLVAIAGIAAYLWFRMPRKVRVLAPLAVLGDVPLMVLSRGGQPDPIYGLFLLIGFAEWPAALLSPIMIGLAVATKQLAWFMLPLYLILVVRTLGWREAGRRMAIIVAVFLALNGPFIIAGPSAYLSSVFGPMSDPMFPLGIGIIAVFVANVVPMVPKMAFTLAELAAWAGGVIAFARVRYLTAASAIVLGALPLYFAWRSLVNYFYLVPLLALAVVFADRRRRLDGVETYSSALSTAATDL